MDGKSLNITEDKIKQLKQLFPEVFAEDKIDFNKLKLILGKDAFAGEERYELNWAGKYEAFKEIQKQTTATLIPDKANSIDFDTSQNIFIEGENLETLRVLQKSYYGKIKMIYIDPPYNTGNDSFVYPDDYSERRSEYEQRTGITDEEGFLNKQDLWKKNSKESGQFHSVWMSMMYPRLFLARNLLKEDGVIFVSIDDNEVSNLKLLMDSIFGEENFVAELIWSGGRKNDSKYISKSHEYILCYCKNLILLKEQKTTWRQKKRGLNAIYSKFKKLKKKYKDDLKTIEAKLKEWFKELPNSHEAKAHKHYSCVDEDGIYFPDNISWPGGGGPKYEVLHPITGRPVKIPSRGWLYSSPDKMQNMIDANKVHFGETEDAVPCLKSYLKDREYQVPYSVLYQDGRASSKRLMKLLNGNIFSHPKDEKIISELIEFISSEKEFIVLDFFAGSGTTAHAVLDLNQADGGNRKFICVQMPEPTPEGSEAQKAGYQYISQIAQARIQKVIAQIKAEQAGKLDFDKDKPQDLGFKSFKLAPSNFKTWRNDATGADLVEQLDIFQNPHKEGSLQENMVYELLLKAGLPLTTPVVQEELGGVVVYNIANGQLLLALDSISEDMLKAVLAAKPKRLVTLDKLFEGNDQLLTNTRLQLKEAGVDFQVI